MKIQKNNYYIENRNLIDSDKILFNTNLIFKYKENIIKDFNFSYWICDTFDIYYPLNENKKEPYLIYSLFDKMEINILRISDKKSIKTLSGPSNYIEKVKNFFNENDKHNYLLSSDWDYIIFVWDLDNNFEKKHMIVPGYSNYIYSFLIYFKLNYIITSTVGHTQGLDFIKIYSLVNGEFIRNILGTDNNDTLYCLIWEKEENESYIIACCYEKISIYNLLNNELYSNLSTNIESSCGDYYFSGFISYDNKYLYTSSNHGFINIWNLYEKTLVKSIKIKDCSFFKIIPCSIYVNYYKDKEDSKYYKNINNNILVCDKDNKGFFTINIIFRKEIEYNDCTNKINNIDNEEDIYYKYQINNFIKNKDNRPIKVIKKIIHPIYGDSILCSSEDQTIDLWTNNPPLIINIFEEKK